MATALGGLLASKAFDYTMGGVASVLVAFAAGAMVRYVKRKRHQLPELVSAFFRFSEGPITIVHSAVFNPERNAFDLPACDTHAAEIIKYLVTLPRTARSQEVRARYAREIIDDDGRTVEPTVLAHNLVLICGPKRNSVTSAALQKLSLRYRFDIDGSTNILADTSNSLKLMASADRPERQTADSGEDYGLLISAPNPFNPSRGMVVLAGLHGTATVGLANHLSDPDKLRTLVNRRDGGVIQEIVRVTYRGQYESIVDTDLRT